MSETVTAPTVHRVRMVYARGEALRYVSHLDMHLVWERTFRRAKLPLVFSQGFNPHPKFHLACALPLGFLSRCELIDVWLQGNALPGTAQPESYPATVQMLAQQAAPPGLNILSSEEVPASVPPLQTQVTYADYLAESLSPIDAEALAQKVSDLLSRDSLPRERRGKPYDLRPLVAELETRTEGDQPVLAMRLSAKESATGRPEEVLDALGFDPADFRVARLKIYLTE